jgi:gliding motility-associated-like protein
LCYAQITGIKINGDTCNSQTLDLQVTGTSSSSYFFWNFGDPASGINDTITITGASSSPFPTHVFTSPGVYTICVTFQEPGNPVSSICRTISIGLCCNGIIVSTDICVQNSISFSILSGATINSIAWNYNDPASGTNNTSNLPSPTHTFSSVGNYTVTANVTASCGTFPISYPITIINCASNCSGIIASIDSCLENGTSFQVVSTNIINSINWNFDDPTSGTNNTSAVITPTHQFSIAGNYTIKAIVNFNCGVDTIEKNISIINCQNRNPAICELRIPNAFSPNSDNINDLFSPLINASCLLTEYKLLIFNKWGEQVFQSTNINRKWNGQYKNQDCPIGVYGYLINCKFANQAAQTAQGDITIVR